MSMSTQKRPRFAFIQAVTYCCLAAMKSSKSAMKSSKSWAKRPTAYNELQHALLVTADNLQCGRPTSEDPDDSAAWGKISYPEILLGLELLKEVASAQGELFLSHPAAAAATLQRMVLQYRALNLLDGDPAEMEKWLTQMASAYTVTDPDHAATLTNAVKNHPRTEQASQRETRFSFMPMWSSEPIAAEEVGPLVLSDGHCGHRKLYSNCEHCSAQWTQMYRESLEARRAWERRQEAKRIKAKASISEAQRLLNERRKELAGVNEKECDRPHTRKFKRGDFSVSKDGNRTWVYDGDENSDPQQPENWKMMPTRTKSGQQDKTTLAEWNGAEAPAIR